MVLRFFDFFFDSKEILMIRQLGGKVLHSVAHRLCLPLLLLGWCFLLALPFVDERRIFVSEHNLKPYSSSKLSLADISLPPVVSKLDGVREIPEAGSEDDASVSSRYNGRGIIDVFAARSSGGFVLVLFVNFDEPSSVSIAVALTRRWRRSNVFNGDIRISYFSDCGSHGLPSSRDAFRETLPQQPVEIAVVLNVSHRTQHQQICLHLFGSDAFQPNLDVVNVMLYSIRQLQLGVMVDLFCQFPIHITIPEVMQQPFGALRDLVHPVLDRYIPEDKQLEFSGFVKSLVTAASVHGDPANSGGSLRRCGIHPIVLQSKFPSRITIAQNTADASWKQIHDGGDDLVTRLEIAQLIEMLSKAASNLDERLHHSLPIYLHTYGTSFVDFEVAQFSIYFVLGSIGSGLFNSYKHQGGYCMRQCVWELVMMLVMFAAVSSLDLRFVVERVPDAPPPPFGGSLYLKTDNIVGVARENAVVVLAAAVVVLALAKAMVHHRRRRGGCSPQAASAAAAAAGASGGRCGGGTFLMLGVWNLILVCLFLASSPLAALLGSLLLATVYGLTLVSPVTAAIVGSGIVWWYFDVLGLTRASSSYGGFVVLYGIVPNVMWAAVLVFGKGLFLVFGR